MGRGGGADPLLVVVSPLNGHRGRTDGDGLLKKKNEFMFTYGL